MTFDSFTAYARATLASAKREALKSGSSTIEIEHLLLGTLSCPDSMAVQVLQKLGVALENVRNTIVATTQPGTHAGGETQLSPRVKKVIEFAVGEMSRQKHEYLGTEHLLLGILREEESSAQGLLHQQGMSLEAARAEIERFYSQGIIESAQIIAPAATPSPQPEDGPSATTLQAPQPAGIPGATGTINDNRQQLAVRYARSRQKAGNIYRLVLFIVVGIVAWLTIQSPQVFEWLGMLLFTLSHLPVLSWEPVAGWAPLLILTYYVLIMVPLLAISLPLAWYIGFVIPRRYGQRKGTTRQWLRMANKSLSLRCIQVWLLVEVAVLFTSIQPRTWWFWVALVQFIFSVLMVRYGTPWLMPLLNKMEPLPEGEISQRLHALLARLNIPFCDIFLVRVSHIANTTNAIFTGWGKSRRIILTDTMTQNFTLDEIEVVLAHELAHLVHRDIWKRLAARSLMLLGLLYLLSLIVAPDFMQDDTAILPLPGLMALVLLLLFAFINLTVRYQRRQEYQADEFALQMTGNVQAFKSAMIKLTEMNLLVATSTRRARHPSSHPTLVKRLQHADEFAARQSMAVQAAHH